MVESTDKPTGADNGDDNRDERERQPYVTPTLVDHGAIAEVTEGAVNIGGVDGGIFT